MNSNEVVEREHSTVDCIVEYAYRVNDVLLMCANDPTICDELKKKLFKYEIKNEYELIRKESM